MNKVNQIVKVQCLGVGLFLSYSNTAHYLAAGTKLKGHSLTLGSRKDDEQVIMSNNAQIKVHTFVKKMIKS